MNNLSTKAQDKEIKSRVKNTTPFSRMCFQNYSQVEIMIDIS
jgi:hypothetical protein